MTSSPSPQSISSIISNIRGKISPPWLKPYNGTALYNYKYGMDENWKFIYFEAEVRKSSLDKGSDLTQEAYQSAKCFGINGDEPSQLIGKKIGGFSSPENAFPLNKSLDTSEWTADEEKVYEFVKQGNGKFALLKYAIEYLYDYGEDVGRPHKIYYKFDLYDKENNQAVLNQIIEGIFENISPRKTNKNFYMRNGYVF